MILGILAAIVVPRYSTASEESRRATAMDQLRIFREQISLYKAEHNELWPGVTAATPAGTAAQFVDHLTLYTDVAAGTAATRDATHKFGPYLPTIPANPISGLKTVKFDFTTNAIPAADNTTGWIFQPATGRLSINTGATDAAGKTYVSY